MGGREDAVGRSHIYETNLLSGARSAARCGARSARGGLVAMPTCSLVPPQGPRTGRRCTNVAQTPHEDERDGVTYYFCRLVTVVTTECLVTEGPSLECRRSTSGSTIVRPTR